MPIIQKNIALGLSLAAGYKIATKVFGIDLNAKTFAIYNLAAIALKAGSTNSISSLTQHAISSTENSEIKNILELLSFIACIITTLGSSKISGWIAKKSTGFQMSRRSVWATRIISLVANLAIKGIPYNLEEKSFQGKLLPRYHKPPNMQIQSSNSSRVYFP